MAVVLGTLTAYGFSRFKVPLKDDLLFFILSTRMMPPIAVAIPVYLMYRELGLSDTKLGMILLYTAVNVSLAVWLLKGFIDEIPREYEEAAMIDGYTRLQAFRKVVLPQAATGIAATAIFCLIFAWNEYAFAVLLTSGEAQTAPPFIPFIIGEGGQDWPAVAAGTTLFLIPIVAFTILLRKHLLRGITFGAVRDERDAQPRRRDGALRRLFRRGPRENVATGIIALGVIMLCQPFLLDLYSYSFRDDPDRHASCSSSSQVSGLRRAMAEIQVENLHKTFGDFIAVKASTSPSTTASSSASWGRPDAARRQC